MKATVKQNLYGNWYGYLGKRKVVEFGEWYAPWQGPNKGQTMPPEAREWLEKQRLAGHEISLKN